jgi:predicted dehydrogenase
VRIRIAAIEVSHWHSLHDSAYLRHAVGMPDVELVGVQDPSADIAARRAAALGHPPVFTDYREMLERTRPDFVIALGRHRSMPETAHYLLDHRYPFLMEKPMGVEAAAVRRIADKAAAMGAFVAVPLGQRYQPFVARARQFLAEGRFGPLSHIYFRLNRPTSARYAAWDSPWMLDPEAAGGGCLRNLGPHGLDLFLFLTGQDAQVTGAQLSWRARGQPVEDFASVLLRSSGGILGTIEVGNTFPRDGTDGEWKIAGRDAILVLNLGGGQAPALRLITGGGEETMAGEPPEPLALTALRDALDHWRRGAPPPISVEDCARAVQLVDQAYELARAPLPSRGGTQGEPNPTTGC